MINAQPVIPLPSISNKKLVRGGATIWTKQVVKDGLSNAFFEPVANPEYPEFLLLMMQTNM